MKSKSVDFNQDILGFVNKNPLALTAVWDKVMCKFHCILTGNELYSSIQRLGHEGEKRKNVSCFYVLSG